MGCIGGSTELWAAFFGAIVGGLFALAGAWLTDYLPLRRKLRAVQSMLALEMRRNLIVALAQHIHVPGFRDALRNVVPEFIRGGEIPLGTVNALKYNAAIPLSSNTRDSIGVDVSLLPREEFDAVEAHFSAVKTLPLLANADPFTSYHFHTFTRETRSILRSVHICVSMLREVGRQDTADQLLSHFREVLGDDADGV
jgi:hypothetical protein